MITKPATIDELLDYWPGNIPFKGSRLVSEDGTCMCAQGQALHFIGGLTVDELRAINQKDADLQVAKLFGISLAHSILLRKVNDKQDGAPSYVIRNTEQVLGDQAQTVLAFWRHLDRMTLADWEAAGTKAEAGPADWPAATAGAEAWEAAGAGIEAWMAVWAAAGAGAESVNWDVSSPAAKTAAWAAAWATNEIQGAVSMRANNQPFVFLPLFGFSDPESVIAAAA